MKCLKNAVFPINTIVKKPDLNFQAYWFLISGGRCGAIRQAAVPVHARQKLLQERLACPRVCTSDCAYLFGIARAIHDLSIRSTEFHILDKIDKAEL